MRFGSRSQWAGFVAAVLVGLAAVVGASVAGFDVVAYGHFQIPGYSMEPAMPHGSTFWTRPAHGHAIHRGDIVLLTPPAGYHLPSKVVGRVVAVGGQTVDADGTRLFVNGAPVAEPYLAAGMTTPQLLRATVPIGAVYVLGDDRVNSVGSRVFGPVPLANVTHRVVRTRAPSVRVIVAGGGIALIVACLCGLAVAWLLRSRSGERAVVPNPSLGGA